jgi:serine/threonine-protein kinase RsbW
MGAIIESRFPGTPLGVRMLRRDVAAVAEDCGMDPETVADVRLAVTEAATNAVVHAYDAIPGDLSVTTEVREGELSIVITDFGPGIAPGRPSVGAGLGLALMASVASRFRVRSRPGGTEIHMAFPCA